MSDASPDVRPRSWAEQFGFSQLFRSFRHAIHLNKLILAFAGVILTYFLGRLLDAIWVSSHKVAASGDITEAAVFIANGGNRAETLEWIKAMGNGLDRSGVFAVLLNQVLISVNGLISAVLSASPEGIIAAIRSAVLTFTWLVTLHPLYALLFIVTTLKIWAFFGGAVCRTAAMDAAREERITLGEAASFAKQKWLSFVMAPLLPIGMALAFGLFLFLLGLVGWIPYAGEFIVGILLIVAIGLGLIIAFVLIGTVGGVGLTFPTIAAEGSDALDALSRTFAYVYQRPWRTVVYYLSVIAHGAICLAFVKLLARLALWSTHLFLGFAMNWGSPSLAGESAEDVNKLDAIWQTPALTGDTTFYGSFGEYELAGLSWFSQIIFKTWIYGLWGLVAAYAMSYFFCANMNIYLLLRREVDMTDIEDVYLEDAMMEAAPAAASNPNDKPNGSGGVSLPVVGS